MKNSYLNNEFFSNLETMAINMRADLLGFFGGKHKTNTHGQTVEFADYREYMLGDDIRRIDWNLYSRFEKHFIKLFNDERQMHVQIFIDCSASIGSVDKNKGDYAVAMAAALGFLAVHNMDKVSFKLIKGSYAEDNIGTIVGKNTFYRAISELENIEYVGDNDLSNAIINCPNTGSNDGLTVIISDFFTDNDWKKAVDYLAYKKRQILLVQVLSPEEMTPTYSGRVNLLDCESEDVADERNMKIRITPGLQAAYDQALADFRDEIKNFCVSRGADFVTISTDTDIDKAIFGELLRTGIMI